MALYKSVFVCCSSAIPCAQIPKCGGNRSAIATTNAAVPAATQSAAASLSSLQLAATASFALHQSATSSYQRQPLQPVPQIELSNDSSDNLECINVLKAWWRNTSGCTSQMVKLTATTDLEDFGQARTLFKLPGRTLHNIYRVQNVTLFMHPKFYQHFLPSLLTTVYFSVLTVKY